MAKVPELWNQEQTIRGTFPPSRAYDAECYFRTRHDVPLVHVKLVHPTIKTLMGLSEGAKLVLQVICRDELSHRGYPVAAVPPGKGRVITVPRCEELCAAGLAFYAGNEFDGRHRCPRYKLKPIAICLCADMGWIKL